MKALNTMLYVNSFSEEILSEPGMDGVVSEIFKAHDIDMIAGSDKYIALGLALGLATEEIDGLLDATIKPSPIIWSELLEKHLHSADARLVEEGITEAQKGGIEGVLRYLYNLFNKARGVKKNDKLFGYFHDATEALDMASVEIRLPTAWKPKEDTDEFTISHYILKLQETKTALDRLPDLLSQVLSTVMSKTSKLLEDPHNIIIDGEVNIGAASLLNRMWYDGEDMEPILSILSIADDLGIDYEKTSKRVINIEALPKELTDTVQDYMDTNCPGYTPDPAMGVGGSYDQTVYSDHPDLYVDVHQASHAINGFNVENAKIITGAIRELSGTANDQYAKEISMVNRFDKDNQEYHRVLLHAHYAYISTLVRISFKILTTSRAYFTIVQDAVMGLHQHRLDLEGDLLSFYRKAIKGEETD
jgi:hypothetical protein